MASPNSEKIEVDRSVAEVRTVLGDLGRRESLPPCLMSLSALIDRVSIGVTTAKGESAFELDEEARTIVFRADVIRVVLTQAAALAKQAGVVDREEATRISQVALNLFVVHELMHVQQNFPHFARVQQIKAGVPGLGLPMLDVAADTAAAWVCAKIEAYKTGAGSPNEFLRHYVNCLIQAYILGAFVFDVSARPEKMQRALGLILSAVLVQAQVDGLLVPDRLYGNWDPGSPLLAFDLDAASAFNAIVLDRMPGLLLHQSEAIPAKLLARIWSSIGKWPASDTIELVAEAFLVLGVISKTATQYEASSRQSS